MIQDDVEKYWWKLDENKLHIELFRLVSFLKKSQGYRAEEFRRFLFLYHNYNSLGLSSSIFQQSMQEQSARKPADYNVIASTIDTLASKIAKNKVKPFFLTNKGDPIQQKKAQKMNQFGMGKFYECRIHEMTPQIFKHAMVWGTGCVAILEKNQRASVEPVFPIELTVDDAEATYGEPRSIYRTKFISREVMKAEFPEKADKLASTQEAKQNSAISSVADQLEVIEAHHLPAIDYDPKDESPENKAKAGLHVIAVENVTLLSEPYHYQTFPYEFLHSKKRLVGFFGEGAAERLEGLQKEISRLLRVIQISMRLNSVPRWLVEMNSKIPPSKINNDIGAIINYRGVKPELLNSNAVPPELREQLIYLIQLAYEQEGASQLSATSKKPAGLDSGKALREYDDIETERFVILGQDWEDFHLRILKQLIRKTREIYDRNGTYEVRTPGKKFLETIDWKEIDLEDDEYFMQVFPTSMLSDTPSGRIADIQDLMQAGMIDPQFGMKLLGFPDLESYTSFMTASLDDILDVIEKLSEGTYQAPEAFQDLQLGLKLVQYAYLRFKSDGLKEERLELFRRWLEGANAMLNPPQPQQAALGAGAPAPGGNGVPQGRAEKPPVAALLPYAGGNSQGDPSQAQATGATIA